MATDTDMTRDPGNLRVHADAVMGVGFALAILGMLAMLAPLVAGVAVTVLVGVLFLAAGLARCVYALRAHSVAAGLAGGALGALVILAGVFMILFPVSGMETLTLFLAAYFVVHGIFEVVLALQLRRARGWGWHVFSGVVSVALGVLIWRQWPLSGVWAVGVLAGVNMLVSGMALLGTGMAARPLLRRGPDRTVTAGG